MRMTPLRTFGLHPVMMALWLATATGCDAPAAEGDRFVVRDSAGTAIVESRSAAWAEGGGWRVSPEPVLRVGTMEGTDPAHRFARVQGLTRLSDGRLVVLEGTALEIRWFTPDGRHQVTRGGRGSGPGELTSATSLLRLRGDTVLVQDAPRIKQILYAPDTDRVAEENLDFDRYRRFGQWLECLTFTLSDRSLVGCQPGEGLQAGVPNRPGMLRQSSRFVRVPWDLSAAYPLGVYRGIEQWGIDIGMSQLAYAVHPHYSRTVVAAGGEPIRIAIATNPDYSIEIWTPEGRLERIIRRPGARAPIDEASRERAVESLRNTPFGVFDPHFDRLRAEIPRPDSLPAIGRMAIDPGGGLWVTRRVMDAGAGPMIDVFSPSGEYLGELRMPPRFTLWEAGADYLLGVRTDEFDVPYVELYSLSRE